MRDAIQIAGVADLAEAEMLVASGVEFIGFPLRLPDGREDLPESEARAIVEAIGRRAVSVCITYLDQPQQIVDLCRFLGAGWVQLHGTVGVDQLAELKSAGAELSVIKSLIVRDGNRESLAREMEQTSPFVDAFITDTFDPATGRTGATGKSHDWSVSRFLVERATRPVILAGGLHPGNVREAILTVGPAGVDAHTGVEDSEGRKDPALVAEFVEQARNGFRSSNGFR